MKKKIFRRCCAAVLCLGLALCMVLTGCQKKTGDSDGGGKSGKEKTISVTLNEVAHSIFYAPMYVAIENGYFEEEGLEITLVTGFGADKTMTALLSGEADIGFMGPETTVYTANEGASDMVVNFAQLTQRAGNFLVAALVAEAKMGLMRHKNAGIILTDDRKRGRKTDDGNRAVRTVPKRTDPSGEHSVLSAGVAQRAEEGRAGDPADRGPGHGPMPPPVRRADVPRHPVAGAELG